MRKHASEHVEYQRHDRFVCFRNVHAAAVTHGAFNAVDHFSGGPVDHHGHNTVVKAVMDKRLPVEIAGIVKAEPSPDPARYSKADSPAYPSGKDKG